MKYRAKNDFFKSFTKGKVYNVEEVNTVEKYRFANDSGHDYYMSEGFLNKYFEKVEEGMKLNFDVNKYIGKAIHCDTEAKANQLLEFLDGQGYMWSGGRGITERNNWKVYSESTCYRIYEDKTITYSDTGYFKRLSFDIIEFDDLLKKDKPRICEIIGKEVGEKFNIKDYKANPCNINKDGEVINNQGIYIRPSMLTKIINHPEWIEDLPKIEYTDRQKEAFKALKNVFNLNFVARDKDDSLWGYTSEPDKGIKKWIMRSDSEVNALDTINCDIFSFLKWEDEPFEIPTIEEEK